MCLNYNQIIWEKNQIRKISSNSVKLVQLEQQNFFWIFETFLKNYKIRKKFCELEKLFHMNIFGDKGFLTVSKRSGAGLKIHFFFQKIVLLAFHLVVCKSKFIYFYMSHIESFYLYAIMNKFNFCAIKNFRIYMQSYLLTVLT